MIVNKQQLANILGKSEEWLTQMQKDQTFPVLERGRGRAGSKYETQDVITWMQTRQVENLIGDKIDIEEAKRRKMAAEASLAEVELETVQGKLIPADQIEKEWSELIMNCRAKLLSIPSKVSPEIFAADDLTTVKVLLKQALQEALNELSVGGSSFSEDSDALSPTAGH
jgi:phage terminase Nu1 subunit (DNA packaging protein)